MTETKELQLYKEEDNRNLLHMCWVKLHLKAILMYIS